MRDNFIFLNKFLNSKEQKQDAIFIGKTKKSVLIGPYTGNDFNYDDFYKRIISSCLYNIKMYKNISERKAMKVIEENNIKYENLKNEMLEFYNDGSMVVHKFINIP